MINITYSKTGFISLCLEQVSMPKANIFHVRCHKKPENSEEKKVTKAVQISVRMSVRRLRKKRHQQNKYLSYFKIFE